MTARPAASYRAARRNAARKAKLLWRTGAQIAALPGGFRMGLHASLPREFVPPTGGAAREAA